jgi:hypothetical protein
MTPIHSEGRERGGGREGRRQRERGGGREGRGKRGEGRGERGDGRGERGEGRGARVATPPYDHPNGCKT